MVIFVFRTRAFYTLLTMTLFLPCVQLMNVPLIMEDVVRCVKTR